MGKHDKKVSKEEIDTHRATITFYVDTFNKIAIPIIAILSLILALVKK